MRFSKYEHDVFISHAVEDKLAIANELFQRLEEAGLNIWYSGKDLRIGDSIDAVIRRNLSRSKYAVVIFSHNYLAKSWTMKELYLLLGHEIAQRKIILPILLDVTVEDLKKKDITIADKFAISAERGLDFIVEKIIEEVRGVKPSKKNNVKQNGKPLLSRRAWIATILLSGLVALSYFVYAISTAKPVPDQEFVKKVIEQRIGDQQAKVEKDLLTFAAQHKAIPSNKNDIVAAFNDFNKLKTFYRNDFEFSNGFKESRFKKNVESDLGIDLDGLTIHNTFGFKTSDLYLSPKYRDGLVDCITYTLISTSPLQYTITNTKSRDNGDFQVTVQYDNNIRGANVVLIFPVQDFPKRYQLSLKGFFPLETFVFQEQDGAWSWTALE